MGLSVNTADTFAYVLEDRRSLPEDQQPKLIFRYLSARDAAKMEKLFEASMAAEKLDEIVSNAVAGISIGLVDWSGYDLPFHLSDIDAVLSRGDLMELVRELSSAMTVSQREKKRSVLQSLSTLAKSVSETPPNPVNA